MNRPSRTGLWPTLKKYSRLWILLALSGLTILALLRLGNIDLSRATLARVQWGWLLLAGGIFYSGLLVRGVRWHLILATMGQPVRLLYAQSLLLAGLFVSNIVPARLGDIGRVAMLKQDHHIPLAQGLASITTERALDILAILTLAIGAALWIVQGRIPPEVVQLMIGTALLFGLGLVGLATVPKLEQWLRENKWLASRLPDRLWSLYQTGLDFGFSLIHGVRVLGRHPLALLLALAESLYIWLCDALLIHFVLVSLGLWPPLSASLFTGMISDLAAAVPLTPGALGQFDAAVIGLLALFDVSTADSSLATLLIRSINLWGLLLLTGLVTYLFGFARLLKLSRRQFDSPTEPAPLPASQPAESQG